MAFPIKPKRRSGASGYPTTLELGELAVNTLDGSLYLGGDSAVMLLNGPVAAGTTVTEHTGDGTTTAFTFAGYNGTADGGYIVSVGGIDQPPSKYSITNTAGGTITFVEAPVSGELISIRALVAGSGGGGSGDATSLQGNPVSANTPTSGSLLQFNGTDWAPFDGVAIQNWNNATQYLAGTVVFRYGQFFQAIAPTQNNDPLVYGADAYWTPILGATSSTAPSDTTTPNGWLKITVPGALGGEIRFVPFYQ